MEEDGRVGCFDGIQTSIKIALTDTVSFAKEPYKRDDILQKRPII